MNVVKTEIDDETKKRLWKKAFEKFGYSKGAISLALREAIHKWLEDEDNAEGEIEKERILNNLAYNKLKGKLIKKYEGKYAIIANGKLIGVADSYEEIVKIANEKAAEAKHCLIFKVEKEATQRKIGRLGWRMKVKTRVGTI